MSDSENRRPVAFRLDQPKTEPAARPEPTATPRTPRALAPETAVVTPDPVDIFEAGDIAPLPPPPAKPLHRLSRVGGVFLSALGILVSLAVGLWTDQLIRDLFARADWLGWMAVGVAGVAIAALLVILIREALGLFRLASVAKLRTRADDALVRADPQAARKLVDDLTLFVAAKPQTAAGRAMLADLRHDVIDGPDLIRLAETEILGPLDAEARIAILNAAKRVSVVTAVSPRALVDVAYVVFESGRLIRRIAELYGGRPGTLGFFRLARSVLAHLAVTGSIAAGDSIVQQLVGHGLAARLSVRLGEGVVNGMMTARIGIAAMETARPLPFSALKRPSITDFLTQLSTFTTAATSDERPKK